MKITPPLKTNSKPKAILLKSSTDTEVLIQLIEYIQVINRIDLLTAVQLALQEVIGAYAIAVLDRENPDEIIAARKSSPLVVGIGQDEFFLASDATPIVEYTDKVVYLEDEEIAVIRCGGETESGESQECGVPARGKDGGAQSRPVGEGRLSAFHVEGDF